jgi:thiamine-phosphate pyrophosphorylase
MRGSENSTFRTLDANFNRASEAFRVIEDIARFQFDDGELAAATKRLRHELASLRDRAGYNALAAARDTAHDIGTAISTAAELQRSDTSHILRANFRRLAEALRVIEEHLKLAGTGGCEVAESLRYRSYLLETSVLLRSSKAVIEGVRLMVIAPSADFERIACELAGLPGVAFQLRDKAMHDAEYLQAARTALDCCKAQGFALIVNDRADICALCGADGVHLGLDDLPVAEARRLLPVTALVGTSTHTGADALAAASSGADYAGAGPCYPSSTKSFEGFPGPEFPARAEELFGGPVFAIGGIDGTNIAELVSLGVRRVAVSAAVCRSTDPRAAALAILDALPD